jgi:hypothetical protein
LTIGADVGLGKSRFLRVIRLSALKTAGLSGERSAGKVSKTLLWQGVMKKTASADQINFPVRLKAGKIRAPIFRVLAVGDYKRVHIYTSLSEYQINVL